MRAIVCPFDADYVSNKLTTDCTSRVSSPAPPHVIQHTTPVRSSPGILTPSSSPLTSLSSLSDAEDQSLENDQPDGDHGMGDLAAAEV